MSPEISLANRTPQHFTSETRYYIDHQWWEEQDKNLESILREICQSYHALPPADELEEQFDWVDSQTAEVRLISKAEYLVRTHCSKQPDFISNRETLVDALLRALLANGNTPLSCQEMAERIHRPTQTSTIARLLGSRRVYNGIRPVLQNA